MIRFLLSLLFGSSACPVDDETRRWLEFRTHWLLDRLSHLKPLEQPVAVPGVDFCQQYCGDWPSVKRLFADVAVRMQVDPASIRMITFSDLEQLTHEAAPHGVGSIFGEADGQRYIAVSESIVQDPEAVAASLASTLAVCRLLTETKMTVDEPDFGPTAELLAIFMGFGLFMATCRFNANRNSCGGCGEVTANTDLGHMSYLAIGYAMAMRSHLCDERDSGWASHLGLDVRSAMRQASRSITRNDEHLLDRMKRTHDRVAEPFAPRSFMPGGLDMQNDFDETCDCGDSSHGHATLSSCGCGSGGCSTGAADHATGSEPGEESADELFTHAMFVYQDGHLQDALEAINRAIDLNNQDGDFYRLRAEIQMALADHDQAREDAALALRMNPGDIETMLTCGRVLLSSEQPGPALDLLDGVIESHDELHDPVMMLVRAYFFRAEANLMLQQPDFAVQDYSDAIEAAPEAAHAEIYKSRARAYDMLGDADSAERDRATAERMQAN